MKTATLLARDELGTCRRSLVSPEQPVAFIVPKTVANCLHSTL